MRKRRTAILSVVAVAMLAAPGMVPAQAATDALVQGFVTPPDSARPRTWWHWTNGNVTEDSITKDLEWMKRAGIAGFQLVDVAAGRGQVVDRKIDFGTPKWYHAVRHSAEEAKCLGLEMSIFSSAGWSEAGGPWVEPRQAMKRLVWSETTVEGPLTFHDKLAQPPSNEGPMRDLSASSQADARSSIETEPFLPITRRKQGCRWPRCIRRRPQTPGQSTPARCSMTA